MKKTMSMRLFFVLLALGCCLSSYAGGYYIHNRQEEKGVVQKELEKKLTEQLSEKQTSEIVLEDSLESSVVVASYEFVLSQEDGYVIVYYADGKTLHSRTDIKVSSLSTDLQTEIAKGKEMKDEAELYNFLENYSS